MATGTAPQHGDIVGVLAADVVFHQVVQCLQVAGELVEVRHHQLLAQDLQPVRM